ncbi:MAG: S-formylglutathione hydrolase [Devosiaceae bacterium]
MATPNAMEKVSAWGSFGGAMEVFDHASSACNGDMRFAIYTPPQSKSGPVPVLWYLSGLTCNWSNVSEKSGYQRYAAEHGVMIICPDTSPRGDNAADDEAYDLGQGAGFYVDATQVPWAKHFQMETYITKELPALIAEHFPSADLSRQGVFGHSMGGHGALTLHLKDPGRYVSVSAFSPIVAPAQVPWGQKAFGAYLGEGADWAAHDATELVKRGASKAHILVDQGDADNFLKEQLKSDLFADACAEAGQKLTLRMQPGYDHSYYFIASFMGDHIAHHAAILKA